ncbi:MAG: ParB/RepB/Spo0J family partition protein [Flavobacteriales bacterium]
MSKKKKALGRGLSALLNAEPDEDSQDFNQKSTNTPTPKVKSFKSVSEIEITSVQTNPYQPRTQFDREMLENLAQSIKELGIIQPITVRRIDMDKYQLISGERRLRAAQMVGLSSVPAFIRTANDQEMLEMAIVENIQRQELDPIEVALSYQRLLDDCQQTQEQVSERLGKKRSTISNFLRLLQLQPLIQAGLRDQMISIGHAKALLSVPDEDLQIQTYTRIVEERLSVRQTEELCQSLKQAKSKDPSKPAPKPIDYSKWKANSEQLSDFLNAKSNIKFGAKGNGKLTIDFRNENDLKRILDLLKQNEN